MNEMIFVIESFRRFFFNFWRYVYLVICVYLFYLIYLVEYSCYIVILKQVFGNKFIFFSYVVLINIFFFLEKRSGLEIYDLVGKMNDRIEMIFIV